MAQATFPISGTDLKRKARALNSSAQDAIEDAMRTMRRSIRRGVEQARDFRDESTYRIKKRPLQSMGLALGVGMVFGLVTGLMIRRCSRAH